MSGPSLNKMLAAQMSYATERQAVLSNNIANLDTPNYKSRDLKKVDFAELASGESGRLAMRATSAKHMDGTLSGGSNYTSQKDRKTFETTPVGNNVVLEEQMAKVSETGAQFQISSSLFKKYTQLYRTAVGNH